MCSWPPASIVLWILLNIASAQENCCLKSVGSCRQACEQLSVVTLTADPEVREQRLLDVHNFCSPQLAQFWTCINETIQDIRQGESWGCCETAQSVRCQTACHTAASRQDLEGHCRHSDELAFFTCLDSKQRGEECCKNARSTECETACHDLLLSSRQTSMSGATTLCQSSPRVLQCIQNITHSNTVQHPHKYLHCCEKASRRECRNVCRDSLRTKSSDQDIIDSLQEGGCGPPLLHDKLWQCFLQGVESVSTSDELSSIDRVGMDSAKLHCCAKAVSHTCRRLCLKTFSNEWTRSWDNLDKSCLSQLSEHALNHCIDEVDEPCELGCDGLSYCTNYNNRPTELFRSCNAAADDAARYDVQLWQQEASLSLLGLQLPLRNISNCSPIAWKTVACTLQIKPCQRQSHANRICREDCYELLSQCLDLSKLPRGSSVAALCARLSPDNPTTPCVSLQPFLQPSDNPYQQPQDQVTAPCKGEPCNGSQICSINRQCQHTRGCQPYTCSTGCKLGEVSQYVVAAGSLVRIPLASPQKGCLKICQCSQHGNIENCHPMPCSILDTCWLPNKPKIDHGDWFYEDCNVCSCYSGEVICTKKQCKETSTGLQDDAYTSLPCNCHPHHVPVCAHNGITFPSSCLAKCAGLTDADFELGWCEAKDPCSSNPCRQSEVCVPARRVCLSLHYKPCHQHQCVNLREGCASLPLSPVCDTEAHQHPNICYLLRYGKTLAYHGPCIARCNRTGVVCGVDGNTYMSECAAASRFVAVDYTGICLAVGLIGSQPRTQCSQQYVVCPSLAQQGCLGITPPGACCPICAGALRVLYSQKHVDRVLYMLKGQALNALTIESIVAALERHVQVAECSLRGHLTIEQDLIVIVVATNIRVSELQLEACVREADKLVTLIQGSSPRIVSELGLSTLTAATIAHSTVASPADRLLSTHTLCPALFLLLRWTTRNS